MRLVARWEGASAWVERQLKWQRVTKMSADAVETLEHHAAAAVFAAVDPNEERAVFDEYSPPPGVLRVLDPSLVDGYPLRAELVGMEGAFWDDGSLVAPWPAGRDLAQHLANVHSEAVVQDVRDTEERYYKEPSMSGDDSTSHRFFGGRTARAFYAFKRDACELALSWCDPDPTAVSKRDEIAELHAELARLRECERRLMKTLLQSVEQPMSLRVERSIAKQLGIDPDDLRLVKPYRWGSRS